jgi:nicotinate-nucleotide adenylyltransferase
MARLACAEFPGFVVDDREMRRSGPSYTVDTLESLRAEFGERPICLLLGSDAFGGFETWHEWERIPELAHVIVMHRPGWSLPSPIPEWARLRLVKLPADLARLSAGRLLFEPVAPQTISGTELRGAIARHKPVQAWLPAAVLEYIRNNHIYMNSES